MDDQACPASVRLTAGATPQKVGWGAAMVGIHRAVMAAVIALLSAPPVQRTVDERRMPGVEHPCGLFDLMVVNERKGFRAPPPPGPGGKIDQELIWIGADGLVENMRQQHDELLPREALARAGRADAEIRLSSGGGFVEFPPYRHMAVFREAGRWWIVAHKEYLTHDGAPRPRPVRTEREVSPATAEQLDRLLGERCLWSAPRMIPEWIRLKTGKWSECHHGAIDTLEVRVGGRRWSGAQMCRNFGPPGAITLALLNELEPGYGGRVETDLWPWPYPVDPEFEQEMLSD